MVISTRLLLALFSACWRFRVLCAGVLLMVAATAVAQVPAKQWDRTYGGSGYDGLASMYPTTDGGYILGGTTSSSMSGDKSQPSRGRMDYWVVKIDAQGTKQWERGFGGDNDDYLLSVQQTADGGYVLGGYSRSDVSGDKTAPGRPGIAGQVMDFWVVKIDAQGTKQWDKTYGGNSDDIFAALQQTTDGGYILGGKSYSGLSNDKSQAGRGLGDYWIVKIDAQGTKQWDRTVGTSLDDALQCLQQTADGGYVVGGWAGPGPVGDRSQPGRGSNDYWVVKLDAQGTKQWDKTYGGNNSDLLQSVRQTADGGYILAGHSDSDASGDKAQGHFGNNSGYNYDYWIVKVDGAGALQWERTYGGAAIESANEVRQTADGGYAIGGGSTSGVSFDKTQPNQGDNSGYDFDYWLLKLDATGAKQWDRTYGGNATDNLESLHQTPDGGYLLAGYSASALSSDKTQATLGLADFWLVKLGPVVLPVVPAVAISGDSVLCPGRALTLTAGAMPAPTSYRWSTGATTASITVSQAGTYSVVATFSAGLTSSRQFRVRAGVAAPLPVLVLGADTTLCDGATLVLRALVPAGPGLRYRWSDGSSAPTLLVQQAGTYSLEITSACESRRATRVVASASCLAIPTIITPNGDPQNEHFVVKGLGAAQWSLNIYNRWGRQVYTSVNYRNEWGSGAAPGVYYYILRSATASRAYRGWFEVAP